MTPGSLDDALRRNIAALAAREPDAGGAGRCGRELDPLALDFGGFGELKALNLGLMRAIPPTRTAAAVVSAKNEGAYLLECVAHYRAIGFEHVFLYTNDNSDGSDALLDALGRTGFVAVLRNEVGPLASPQIKAYEHSIHLLRALRDFEWVSYFDVDEFLIPAERRDHSIVAEIAALRRRCSGRLPSAICCNWQWYGSDGHVCRADGLVQERFSYSVAHPLVKSLVRLADIDTMAAIHLPGPTGLALVNAAFDPIAPSPEYWAAPPGPGHGRLNHYYQKSFEEFGIKSARGRGDAPGGREGKGYDTFFEWEVPLYPANRSPTPPRLLARVRREVAALESMPGVAAAARETQEAHRTLSRRIHGGDVEARFCAMRARLHSDALREAGCPCTT